ncbi:MAG: YIP1 family protein [Elusimicrobia bacterium]|nr:YIP1 family protein [Elusimicrobiota bacterium]
MVDPRCVDYIRTNQDKYPLNALKAELLKAGVTPADVEEAVRLATAPPPQDIPATAPPVRRAPASFAEIFPTAAASPAPAQEPARPRPAQQSLPQGMLPRMRAILLSPAGFFRAMPRGGGWREPMLFVLAMSLACAVLQIAMVLAFGSAGLGPSRAALTVFAAVFSVAGALVAALVGTFIAAGLAHLIWLVLGSQQPFEASLRCVAFMSALLPVLGVAPGIPIAGPWLAIPLSLYGAYLFFPASIEVHEVDRKKASAAAFALGFLALLVTLVSAFGSARLRSAARGRPPSLMEASSAAAKTLPPLPNAPTAEDLQRQMLSQIAQFQAQTAAGAAARPGSGPPPSPEQALQAVNAALGALGGASGVKAAAPQSLEALLPAQIPGLTRAGARNGTQKLGAVEMAMAEASYRAESGGAVTVQLIDAAGYSSLISMAMGAGGGRGALSYKSCPGLEQYDPGSRSGSFQVIAAGRFAVKVSGQNVEQKALRSAMDAVDLDALGRLAR